MVSVNGKLSLVSYITYWRVLSRIKKLWYKSIRRDVSIYFKKYSSLRRYLMYNKNRYYSVFSYRKYKRLCKVIYKLRNAMYKEPMLYQRKKYKKIKRFKNIFFWLVYDEKKATYIF